MLRADLARIRKNPGDFPLNACDNSCVVCRPEGMATNGGCRCDERKLRTAVMWLWRKVHFLEETIRDMRGAYTLCPHHYDADDKPCLLHAGHPGVHGTIDEVLESHDRWRTKAGDLQGALFDLLPQTKSVDDVLRKFSLTKQRAEEIWKLSGRSG